jgi:protein gp37
MLSKPLYWKRPRKIFVNSMSDLFHEAVPDSFIDQVFAVMALARQHTFQILTKRPQRMRDYCLNFSWERVVENCRGADGVSVVHLHTLQALKGHFGLLENSGPWADRSEYPLPNVWLGASAEDQKSFDDRVESLLDTPAAVRWLSIEPMLGPIDMSGNRPNERALRWHRPMLAGIHWVVAGGETGPRARPQHPAWPRRLRDQCKQAGVRFLYKQHGDWAPAEVDGDTIKVIGHARFAKTPKFHVFEDGVTVAKIGKRAAGRLLDGVTHDEYPPALKAEGVLR